MSSSDCHQHYKKWQKRHEDEKKRGNWPTTQDGWVDRWREALNVIANEADKLREDRDIYNTYRRIVLNNPRLDKRNEFLVLVEDMYISHALIGIRKFDDRDPQSHSMYNLIAEIIIHHDQITKSWFVGQYDPELRQNAEKNYDRDWGSGPQPDKEKLRDDLCSLVISCSKIREICNKYIAHIDREQPRLGVTYSEIDKAIDVIYGLSERYYLLLFAESRSSISMPAFTNIFDIPWNHKKVG